MEDKIYLTCNERSTLRFLLNNGRLSDVSLGEKLKISPQAANKIRKKLEKIGIIKDYIIEVDYNALGINIFSLVLMDFLSSPTLETDFLHSAYGARIISFYRIVRNGVSHFALCGFKNLNDLDGYFNKLHSDYNHAIKVKKIYIFPTEKLIKNSSKDLFYDLLKEFRKEKDRTPEKIALSQDIQNGKGQIKLNINEKKILKILASDGRISCKKISLQLSQNEVSNRAIINIKDRLEKKGAIRGYSSVLDYNKLGINLLAFFFLKKKPSCWKFGHGMGKWAAESRQVIGCYHINEDATQILSAGFKDVNELEHYSFNLHKTNSELFDIDQIYIVPNKGIIKESSKELIQSVFD